MRFQIETSAPSVTRAQATARAEPPAPSTRARSPAGAAGSESRKPLASVFSAAIRPPEKLSVLAAPIASAASEASSASSSAATLCGTVTLAPTKPSLASRRTSAAKSAGATSIAS